MKLPEETKDDLFSKRTAVPLRYFAKDPVKKSRPCFLAMRRRVVRHYMDTLGRASSMS